MAWFKVDDGFHSHPKVLDLSPSSIGIWALMGSWSAGYLTDGCVRANIIERFGGTSQNIAELVNSGLWIDNGDGTYQFKDWDEYQPKKVDIEAEREAARERMRLVRARKKGVNKDVDSSENVRPNNSRSSEEVRVTPSHPSPSHISNVDADASTDTHKPEQAFEDWYKNYPKKVGKGQARKAFKAALKKTDLDTLKAGVESYRHSVEGRDREFIANPATWLNGERWDDDNNTKEDDQWEKWKSWTKQN